MIWCRGEFGIGSPFANADLYYIFLLTTGGGAYVDHHFYPIFLNLAGRLCLVVGGGSVAVRKVPVLLEYGATVLVISPHVRDEIKHWHEQGQITWKTSNFTPDDLRGVELAFITTDNAVLNHEIAEHCRQRGILVNAVDDPLNCDFYVPAVLRRGSLAIAISTEGRSPMFAAHLRRKLEDIITEEYGEFVEVMGQLRTKIMQSGLNINERHMIFEAMINSDLLHLMLSGEKEKVKERIEQCISSLQG